MGNGENSHRSGEQSVEGGRRRSWTCDVLESVMHISILFEGFVVLGETIIQSNSLDMFLDCIQLFHPSLV